MNKTQTILTIISVGIIVFSLTASIYQWERAALKSGWFWVGLLALWLFWSALICALINNQITIQEKLKKIDEYDRLLDK